MTQKELWSGRFKGGMSSETLDFTSSLDVDSRMAWYDIVGSMAHARMLGKQGILPKADVDLILRGLRELLASLEDGELEFDQGQEDVHTNVEVALTDRIGEAGDACTRPAAAMTRWPPTSACTPASWYWRSGPTS